MVLVFHLHFQTHFPKRNEIQQKRKINYVLRTGLYNTLQYNTIQYFEHCKEIYLLNIHWYLESYNPKRKYIFLCIVIFDFFLFSDELIVYPLYDYPTKIIFNSTRQANAGNACCTWRRDLIWIKPFLAFFIRIVVWFSF